MASTAKYPDNQTAGKLARPRVKPRGTDAITQLNNDLQRARLEIRLEQWKIRRRSGWRWM